jgi:hypothetical protein
MSGDCERPTVAEMKARQTAKLKEIREALLAEGCERLDQQAAALGLPRSTVWTIVTGNHKASGLSAPVLHRMLSSPRLPYRVRIKLVEYIAEKSVGRYGGTPRRLQSFVDRMKSHEEARNVGGNDCES